MKTSKLGLTTITINIKKAGADIVTKEYADELRRIVEDNASESAKNSIEMAKHAGRKTIKAEDIKLGSKSFSKY